MRKYYVIKNKEGEYYTDVIPVNEIIFTELIENAWQFNKEQDAKDEIDYRKMKDCKIVPITICEGDLEEENRVLKRALELACERVVGYECEMLGFAAYWADEDEKIDKINDFIQQAKEMKDE